MNISQSLRRVAFLKGEYHRLAEKLPDSITFREGNEPSFRFEELWNDMETISRELQDLRARIAFANATTMVEVDGRDRTLISLINELRELKAYMAVLQKIIPKTRTHSRREATEWNSYTKTEKQFVVICDYTERQADADYRAARQRFAKINAALEAANQSTSTQ